MWLANVLLVFGWPAVKHNTECACDNVLLLCAHVMQCPIPVCRQYNNIYAVLAWHQAPPLLVIKCASGIGRGPGLMS